MKYNIEIVDTYDRDFLTYEIWDNENNLIAEIYMSDNGKYILDFLTIENKTKKGLDFIELFNVLKMVYDEIKK